MDTIISVQDIRTSLSSIAGRVEAGESFMVVRNSKPAFRIVPVVEPGLVRESKSAYSTGLTDAMPTWEKIRERFEEMPVTEDELTPTELDRIIHEVHAESNRKMRADADRGI